MSLIQKLKQVQSGLARSQPHYATARTRRAELAPYATPEEVALALHDSSALSPEERYALIAAVLTEHAEQAHPLWTSILVAGFAPLLFRERARLGFPEDEERDHRVLLAFLAGIPRAARERTRLFATAVLERATRRGVVVREKKERAEQHVAFEEDAHSPCDPHGLTEAELRIEQVWAARRAARAQAERSRQTAVVRALPAGRRTAA
jgi:hypothetical protein